VLDLDSCWVQLLDPESRELRLAGSRGLTPAMERAAGLRDSEQGLSNRVVMGHRAFIPDLSRDGAYGLSSFTEAGMRSIIAVPIRTYRTHGVIGIAGRSRRQFPPDATDLLTAVAGMLGATLNATELGRLATSRGAASGEHVEAKPVVNGASIPEAGGRSRDDGPDIAETTLPEDGDSAASPADSDSSPGERALSKEESVADATFVDTGGPGSEAVAAPPGAAPAFSVSAESSRAATENHFIRHGRTMDGFRRSHS
jgi:hypothetical protein